MSDVLITGGTGTVGSNLDFGYKFGRNQYDLRLDWDVDNLIKHKRPSSIVHCAAIVGGLKMHLTQQYSLFYENLLINSNVIEAARRHKVPRILSMLSSCVFSDFSRSPYDESMVHEHEPFDVHLAYGHVKRMLEFQSRLCYDEGLKYNCVIPTNIYGINDDFNMETGHVIGVLIHKAYLAKQNKTPFVVWGDGNQEREFLFTKDIAHLIKWALYNYLDREPLILSNNVAVKIGDVARIIADKFGIRNQLEFDTSQPSGQRVRRLSGNKLKRIYPFDFTPIDEGINETIDWFVKRYPRLRK